MLNQVNSAPKAHPCAACGAESTTTVWDSRICYQCHAWWMADPRFEAGSIEAAVGRIEDLDAAHKAYCAEATKRTRAWLGTRKARAA